MWPRQRAGWAALQRAGGAPLLEGTQTQTPNPKPQYPPATQPPPLRPTPPRRRRAAARGWLHGRLRRGACPGPCPHQAEGRRDGRDGALMDVSEVPVRHGKTRSVGATARCACGCAQRAVSHAHRMPCMTHVGGELCRASTAHGRRAVDAGRPRHNHTQHAILRANSHATLHMARPERPQARRGACVSRVVSEKSEQTVTARISF